MNLKDTKIALINICDAIVSEENLLTEADSSIGDGDHGIGMTRGFKEAKNRLENSLVMSISECFSIVGNSLLLKSGGASGAIFGTFFNTASKSLIQEKQLNKKNPTHLSWDDEEMRLLRMEESCLRTDCVIVSVWEGQRRRDIIFNFS